jgi:hypothetical protein
MEVGRVLTYPARWFGADFSAQDAGLERWWDSLMLHPDEEKFTKFGTKFSAEVAGNATYFAFGGWLAEVGGQWVVMRPVVQAVAKSRYGAPVVRGVLLSRTPAAGVSGVMLGSAAKDNAIASYYSYQLDDVDGAAHYGSQAFLQTFIGSHVVLSARTPWFGRERALTSLGVPTSQQDALLNGRWAWFARGNGTRIDGVVNFDGTQLRVFVYSVRAEGAGLRIFAQQRTLSLAAGQALGASEVEMGGMLFYNESLKAMLLRQGFTQRSMMIPYGTNLGVLEGETLQFD